MKRTQTHEATTEHYSTEVFNYSGTPRRLDIVKHFAPLDIRTILRIDPHVQGPARISVDIEEYNGRTNRTRSISIDLDHASATALVAAITAGLPDLARAAITKAKGA